MPAWSGVPGPGEITRWVGAQRLDARHVDRVVAADLHLGPQLAEVLDQVVGEAVVVVDHDDPWHRRPYQSLSAAATSMARKSAAALFWVSSYSAAGTESATIPAPACTWAIPSWQTTVRIVMQVSRLPSQPR